MFKKALFLIICSTLPNSLAAQSVQYADGRGGVVNFPLGIASFADEVVASIPGDPAAHGESANPEEGLGVPNFVSVAKGGYATLGCGGSVVYRFVDNALVDVDGPDLFVFEVGPDVEATELAISGDAITWIEIGRIEGATAAIDLADSKVPPGSYAYLRLTDDGVGCSGRYPGADIDAVGAIGAGTRVVFDASLLFDFDSAALKPTASRLLDDLALRIAADRPLHVIVEGHTDSDGSAEYNINLSQERAATVAGALSKRGIDVNLLNSVGHGESRPAAPNDNDANKALNRRVEVILIAS
ncbi:MAG: OmpA family protein [Alphaproteobacteria bacterium]|nr:OmpA family protein [Alphaproteobacteria bacterium]